VEWRGCRWRHSKTNYSAKKGGFSHLKSILNINWMQISPQAFVKLIGIIWMKDNLFVEKSINFEDDDDDEEDKKNSIKHNGTLIFK
jgi:hypothetical protein